MKAKPTLALLTGSEARDAETLARLHRKLTGRDPTPDEIADAKRKLAAHAMTREPPKRAGKGAKAEEPREGGATKAEPPTLAALVKQLTERDTTPDEVKRARGKLEVKRARAKLPDTDPAPEAVIGAIEHGDGTLLRRYLARRVDPRVVKLIVAAFPGHAFTEAEVYPSREEVDRQLAVVRQGLKAGDPAYARLLKRSRGTFAESDDPAIRIVARLMGMPARAIRGIHEGDAERDGRHARYRGKVRKSRGPTKRPG